MAIQEEARKGIIAICAAHKGEPSPLMPILEEIQKIWLHPARGPRIGLEGNRRPSS
jgi:NADH:ubiquinone oxidoreductase subunit E